MSMANISMIFFYIFLFSFSQVIVYGRSGNGDNGFSVSLFHRDSPLSPLYNPSLSHYNRLNNAFRRSFSRVTALFHRASASPSPSPILESPISPGGGEYLMSVSIGTPPVAYVAIADTGSDLTWTQCLPCLKCYDQSQPIFNPLQSSSFNHVSCTSQICHVLDVASCGNQGVCNYSYTYGDQTYTKGDLGFDKITLGSTSVNTVFGCGHESGGGFGNASGVIGFGGGELSLISQMSKNNAISRRFSYCLPSVFSQTNGQINFGQNAVISGPGVVSMSLVGKSPSTWYSMTLEAVTVGNDRHVADMSAAQGNMIIDTGTTLTTLPKELYDGVVSSLVKVIQGRRVNDPGGYFELCYAVDDNDLKIPVITAHFDGSADVNLMLMNTFTKVADDVSFLTLTPSSPSDPFGILGNLAQANFLIGYDLELRTLSFKQTICA